MYSGTDSTNNPINPILVLFPGKLHFGSFARTTAVNAAPCEMMKQFTCKNEYIFNRSKPALAHYFSDVYQE